MLVETTVTCPFCAQLFSLSIDTSVSSQRYVTDCEICCRPLEVYLECEPGEVVSVEIISN